MNREETREDLLGTIDYWVFKYPAKRDCGCAADKERLCDVHEVMVDNEVQRRLNFFERWISDIV